MTEATGGSYTLREAADRLGVSARTVRRYVVSGTLRASQLQGPNGWEYRIAEEELAGFTVSSGGKGRAKPRARTDTSHGKGEIGPVIMAMTERLAGDSERLERAWARIAELEGELATARARLAAPASESLSWRERITGRRRGV